MSLAGDVFQPGTAVFERYQAIEDLPRGTFFSAPGQTGPLQDYATVAHRLPAPYVDAHPEYRSCYDTCVRLLFGHQHVPAPGSGFRSNYLDAAFNTNVFLWDTAFIVMFARLLDPYVPAVSSLDNFYARQYPDGEICREFSSATGKSLPWWVNLGDDGLYSFFHRDYGFRLLGVRAPGIDIASTWHPDLGRVPAQRPLLTLDALNNPVLAWAEWESYRQTGDAERVAAVLPALHAYFWAFDEQTRHASGLYVTDWASMDNSPRNDRVFCGVDTAAQMVLFARDLERLDEVARTAGLDSPVDLDRLRSRRDEVTRLINERMWDEERGFYVDLDADLRRIPVRTVAAFWTLVAEVAPPERARLLVRALEDPAAFNRPHQVPTVPADEPSYVAEGGYWRGGVWAPINQMVVAGLDRAGYPELAAAIATNHVDALARIHEVEATVFEYYSPEHFDAGANDHRDFVGWSGMGPIGFFMTHVVGVQADAATGTLTWRPPASSPSGIERYWFAGRTVDLRAEPDERGGCTFRVEHGEGVRLDLVTPGGERLAVTVDADSWSRRVGA